MKTKFIGIAYTFSHDWAFAGLSNFMSGHLTLNSIRQNYPVGSYSSKPWLMRHLCLACTSPPPSGSLPGCSVLPSLGPSSVQMSIPAARIRSHGTFLCDYVLYFLTESSGRMSSLPHIPSALCRAWHLCVDYMNTSRPGCNFRTARSPVPDSVS